MGLEADDRIERALPAAAAFSGGRVLRVAVSEADGAVRRNLLSIVGSNRLNDCMWVDQLIFKEELASTPASPRR